jgi:hypothetical protein
MRPHRRTFGPTHTRYIGDAVVRIEHFGRGSFEAEISIAGDDEVIWEAPINSSVRAPDPDDPDFIDRLAASVVALAVVEGGNARVRRATAGAEDDQGYVVERGNPAGLTAKGERMYEHVKASYAGDPRAKEIAARTVIARVGGGAQGLKKNPKEPEYVRRDRLVAEAASEFPDRFGLRAFPGDVFTVDLRDSYYQDGVHLYVHRVLPDGRTQAFSKDSPERLRREMTAAPGLKKNAEPRRRPFSVRPLMAERAPAEEIAWHVKRGEFDKAERAARAYEDFFLDEHGLREALNLIREYRR